MKEHEKAELAKLISIVVKEAMQSQQHHCRFGDIDPKSLRETVLFCEHFNKIKEESGSVIRKTILVLGVTGTITLIGYGILTKLAIFLKGTPTP